MFAQKDDDKYLNMAADCWCDPRCHSVPMYPELARVMAEKLKELATGKIESKSLPDLIREGREL